MNQGKRKAENPLRKYNLYTVESIWENFREEFQAKGKVRPAIVVHGGYGKKNLGDDAILEVILASIKKTIPSARLMVLAHEPREVIGRHRVRAYHFLSSGALRAILEADLYILGGGGIINRVNTYSGFRRWRILDPKGKFLFIAAALAKLFGAKVVFYAIGATSVPDPVVGFLAKNVINWADAVSVRDPLSKEILQSLGIRKDIAIVLDPTVALKPVSREEARSLLLQEGVNLTKFLVGINFRYVAEKSIDNAQTIRTVAQLTNWLIGEHKAEVVFLPFSRHPFKKVENDTLFAQEVRQLVKNSLSYKILEKEYSPVEMMGILREMKLCLLERLHAVIFAAMMGIPFVGVAYDRKVAQFLEMVGLSQRKIELSKFDFASAKEKLNEIYLRWQKAIK